jgi:hypothetical protein
LIRATTIVLDSLNRAASGRVADGLGQSPYAARDTPCTTKRADDGTKLFWW